MKYRAVFFDRDGTLSHQDAEIAAERDQRISEIVGKPFELTDKLNTTIFFRVWDLYPELKPVQDLETENRFWEKWFHLLLIELTGANNAEKYAQMLCRKYVFYKIMRLYPETVEVLEYFRAKDLKIGAISDTFPSLELTLKLLGIREYFDTVTASSLVGAGKPDPRIFNHALSGAGVSARESYFVDDTKPEADGARRLGFTSFHLDRKSQSTAEWSIATLKDLVEYDKRAI